MPLPIGIGIGAGIAIRGAVESSFKKCCEKS